MGFKHKHTYLIILLLFLLALFVIVIYKSAISTSNISKLHNTGSIANEEDKGNQENIELGVDLGDQIVSAEEVFEGEKINLKKDIQSRQGLVFSNLEWYLQRYDEISFEKIEQNNRGIIFPTEFYSSIPSSLFSNFVETLQDCEIFNISDQMKQECMFEYYFKQSLISQGSFNVPESISSTHVVFDDIRNKKCSELNALCMSMGWEGLNFSRDSIQERYKQSSSQEITKVLPINIYGILLFTRDISDISLQEGGSILYDQSLIFKSLYNNDVQVCSEIENPDLRTYCEDHFAPLAKEKYKDLFKEYLDQISS